MKYLALVSSAMLFALPALSAPVSEDAAQSAAKRSYWPAFYEYDDASTSGVTYSGAWTHLTNQGHKLYQKTESYTGQANAEVRFDAPDASYGINSVKIYSTKKSDRGNFNVYCGKSLVGTGNEYSSGAETDTMVVFDKTVNECLLPNGGSPYIVIKNDRGAKYLAIDKVEIFYGAI